MPDWFPSLADIKDIIVAVGWVKGVFALFFFVAHGWIYQMYAGRLKDRQAEIDRLAAENREYRDRFLSILDKKFKYTPPKKLK